ncbi:MAG: hypothetical protein J6X53_10115, partial [Abditibacteriota bacterium]|nr:hypothetical protein [Abditibacteriota bacterium]
PDESGRLRTIRRITAIMGRGDSRDENEPNARPEAEKDQSTVQHTEQNKPEQDKPEQNQNKPETKPKPEKTYDIGYGYLGNGLTVWNRAEQENGDYKTIAHIDPERKVTFYEDNLPEEIRERIQRIAATDNSRISATQDTPVFSTPPTVPEKAVEAVTDSRENDAFQSLVGLIVECEYFLADTQHDEKRLTEGSVGGQIAKMRELYAQLSGDHEGLTEQDIDEFARRMLSALAQDEQDFPDELSGPEEPGDEEYKADETDRPDGTDNPDAEQADAGEADRPDGINNPETEQTDAGEPEAPHSTGEKDIYPVSSVEPELDGDGNRRVTVTQEDVNRQLRLWNRNLASKFTIARYLKEHGQEPGAASWLAREFGETDMKPRLFEFAGSQNSITLTWDQMKDRVLELIRTKKFFTLDELSVLNPSKLPRINEEEIVSSASMDNYQYTERKTKSGLTYHVGDVLNAELDVSGGVMMASIRVQAITRGFVLFTLPDVPNGETIPISRAQFEFRLETGLLYDPKQPKPVHEWTPPKPKKKQSQSKAAKNYRTFVELFPEIANGEYRYLRLEVNGETGYMPLHVQWIDDDVIALSHTHIVNGDMMNDPEMTFRVDHEKGTLEP